MLLIEFTVHKISTNLQKELKIIFMISQTDPHFLKKVKKELI